MAIGLTVIVRKVISCLYRSQSLLKILLLIVALCPSLSAQDNPTKKVPKAKTSEMADKKLDKSGVVSFSGDIAPILIANCNGCHINAMPRRGGLSMDTFAQISKGGESGEMIVAKDSKESLLVQKIRGTAGQRMPAGGKPPLKEEEIGLIAKWVDQGAVFDGASPATALATLTAKAWADSASYEEVMQKRRQRAMEKWKKAFGNQSPKDVSDNTFVIIGNLQPDALTELLESAKLANDKVRKALKINSDTPLAKGGVTIFAIQGRYDYSEFGKMTESRSLPSTWKGHWRRDDLDVYIAILCDTKDPKSNQSNLTQQLASVWVSQFEGTPGWFADGFGRAIFATIAGKNDTTAKTWDKQIGTIVGNMKSSKELLDGKMNEEDAAIVGYGLCRKMMDSSNRSQFNNFLRGLSKSQSFPDAFQSAFGPIETSVSLTLGIQPTANGK